MLTETTPTQDKLSEIFELIKWARRIQVIQKHKINKALTSKNTTTTRIG